MKKELQSTFQTRQYMLSKDFELYYYSDRHAPKTKLHTHDYYEFYFFLEGEVSLSIDGKSYSLERGDIVLIPPNIKHYACIHSSKEPYSRFIFWISREYLSYLSDLSNDYVYLIQQVLKKGEYIFHNDAVSLNAIQSKVFGVLEEIHFHRFGSQTKLSLSVKDLILSLNRIVYERDHSSEEIREENLYQSIVSYIESHLEEEITLDRLAKEFYMSKYYIAHIVKENLGLSVHQYLLKKRLAACKEAITWDASIHEICLSYGFKDYSSFYRAFKKEYGSSPKEYKELRMKLSRKGKKQEKE